jgi:hypothetical protein
MQKKSRYSLLMMAALVAVAGFFVGQSGTGQVTKPSKNPSPADAGTMNGVPLRGAKPDSSLVVPKLPGTLRVDRMDLWRLKAGTVAGKTGDWAMVLHGEGFFEAEYAPVVHLGEKITLGGTSVNADGSELYVVMPSEVMEEAKKAKFRELAVQNPSGLDRNPERWGRLAIEPRAFAAAADSAGDAKFERGTYSTELTR